MPGFTCVIVDYLNLGALFSMVSHRGNCRRVRVLFRARNRWLERVVEQILSGFGFEILYVAYSAQQTYRSHTELADEMVARFLANYDVAALGGVYFHNRLGQMFFARVYRLASMLAFIRHYTELWDAEQIYFAGNRLWRHIHRDPALDGVIFYRALAGMDDRNYTPPYRPSQLFGVRPLLRSIVQFIISVLAINPAGWPRKLELDAILCLHPNTPKRRWFGQEEVKRAVGRFGLLNKKLNVNGRFYRCRRVPLAHLSSYLKHGIRGRFLLSVARPLGLSACFLIFGRWMHAFQLAQMFDDLQPAVFYSNYESDDTLLIQHVLKSRNCVSAASTYSGGIFPMCFEVSHQVKNADIYFVWGSYFSELCRSSGDLSRKHVVVGYVGDHYRGEFIKEAKALRWDKEKKVVTVYDSTFYDDLFINREDTFRFVELIVRRVVNKGARVIIKSKIGLDKYNDLCQEFPQSVALALDKASISAAMAADIVIGYLSSSPVLIAGVWGKPIILFDPNGMIWEQTIDCIGSYIATTEEELLRRIDDFLNGANIRSPYLHSIDPFGDGRAIERIADVLKELITLNENEERSVVLKSVLQRYGDRWGKDKVIKL
jgi:hypothetical protein